jgi:predicted nucleic acid-binding protein
LLDTNVVCETAKPQPDGRLPGWLGRQPAEAVFISAITPGEVRHGAMIGIAA